MNLPQMRCTPRGLFGFGCRGRPGDCSCVQILPFGGEDGKEVPIRTGRHSDVVIALVQSHECIEVNPVWIKAPWKGRSAVFHGPEPTIFIEDATEKLTHHRARRDAGWQTEVRYQI